MAATQATSKKTWVLRILILCAALGLSVGGYLASPADAKLSRPGPVIQLTEHNILPKPYTLTDSAGEWDVLTVNNTGLSVFGKLFYTTAGTEGRVSTEASNDNTEPTATNEELAIAARQMALNTALETYSGYDSMAVVHDTTGTDIPEGSRVLSINHEPPTTGTQPAGTWLIASPLGGVEVHEVTRTDLTTVFEPVRPQDGTAPVEPDIDAVSAPVFDLADIGGPSSGLALTLAWLDALSIEDLTGGLHIAATGALGPDGAVYPVGDVDLKLLAADKIGAELVLIPEGYDGPIPEGLNVHEVATIDEALQVVAEHS